MNWRGRPLTSHEVVVKTIAATRTSGGLRVEAALDTGDYPTGVAISRQRLDALPIQRHAVHGTWNYTLRPQLASCATEAEAAQVGEPGGPAQRRQAMLQRLADPRLTGMTSTELERLAAALAPAQAARAQQRHSQQRGGRARRATGNLRSKPLLDDAARLLITLLYQRQVCSMNVLSDLLEVTATCIGDTVKQTREVLEDHGHTCGAAPVRFPTAQALRAFLDTDTRPERTQVLEQLSHPALTGISRPDLQELTERLAPRQTAQAERLSYQRRGGPRQAGTRSGVFHQKISNRERVLLTILYQRRICTMGVLAELFDVCRSSIGNAIRQPRPLLEHTGHTSTPAPTHYRTATELRAPVTPSTATANTNTPTRRFFTASVDPAALHDWVVEHVVDSTA
jgi:hypothetical protein